MLELEHIHHSYGETQALRDVSLRLDEGCIGGILGPSGCGKTTALRCIAGFEKLTSGDIRAGGVVLNSHGQHLAPEERRIGMVFQDYALLPHLSALENVMFGLHARSTTEQRSVAADFLKRVGLADFRDRYPHELSGGQQQRVAIARALAPEPRLLLMDEPFSNLDVDLRQVLGQEVRALLKQLGATALVAMHDHHDAFAVADEIGVMRQGRLLQWGSAYELYHRPTDRFVAEFVGKGVWLQGTVVAGDQVETSLGRFSGRLTDRYAVGTPVDVLLRPDDVVHDDDSAEQANVLAKQFKGSEFLYEVQMPDGTRLLSSVPSHHDHPVGEPIGIRLETDHIVVFARD